ncbi:MAG: allophanate hydrolase [Pseudomonadota bacterium]
MRSIESGLLTLEDWRHAYLNGALVRDLVPARARRLFDQGPEQAWILQVDDDAIAQRCTELDAVALEHEDRAALLRALPLYGVPFVVKDNIDVAGLATTAACPAYSYVPHSSATVVRKLLAAGAVLLGKTNLDQFATGLVGTRSPFGAPASVLAKDRISGGSSSGSAVLVGHGHVPFSLGTDTAGSGRVPAGFNNIVGLKPTPGRVGTVGVVPACRSLDCVSIFTLTVEDAAAVLAVVEGPDTYDDFSAFVPGRVGWPQSPRVGIPRDADVDDDIGYDVAWRAACNALSELGVTVKNIDFGPLHEVARLLYDGPWIAERLAVVEPLLERHPEAIDPTVKAVIGRARELRAVDTFRAQYALRRGQQVARRIWDEVDLLMVPTAPRHPHFDEVAADPIGANARLGAYTNFVNLLGWSALALPAGFTPNGLPFGITFIAAGGADAALVRWGRRWQQAMALPLGGTGQRRSPAEPPSWPAAEPTLPLAVVGAHLSGLPLNIQLTERGALWRETTTTSAYYRLYALPGTRPAKPGLQRVPEGGHAIEVEVWDMPLAQFGSFLALVPPPLALGSIELADGRHVHGFLCEAYALADAPDISRFGGWRAYLASL